MKAHGWQLVGVLLLAAALRLWGLNRQGIWWDEAVVANVATLDAREIPKYLRVLEKTPPAHYELIHFWVLLFPNNEWWIRFPSVIFGVAAVGTMFVLVRKLSGHTVSGVGAALLLALDPYHIRYSQEARAYALMVLLALAATHLLVRAILDRSGRCAIAYVIVAALLLYTHLYGATVVAGHAITCTIMLAIARRRIAPWWWLVAMIGVPLVLFVPWMPTVWTWTHDLPNGHWMLPFGPRELGAAYAEYVGGYLALVFVFVLVMIAIVKSTSAARAALLPLMLMPVIPAVAVSLIVHPLFIRRYGIAAIGGLLSLAGMGWANLPRFRSLALIAGAGLLAMSIRYPLSFPDWRSVGEYLTREMRHGDAVAVTNSNVSILYDYYVNRRDIPMARFDSATIPIAPPNPNGELWVVIDGSFTPESEIVRGWQVIGRREFSSRDAGEYGRAVIVVLELKRRAPP